MLGTVKPSASMQSILRSLIFDMDKSHQSSYFSQDLEYILSRLENEGTRFAFITMPELGKAIERSFIMETNLIVPDGWILKKNTALPRLFYQHFSSVWSDSGSLLPTIKISNRSAFLLRQFFLIFSKVENGVEEDKVLSSVHDFRARTTRQISITANKPLVYAREILERIFNTPLPQNLAIRWFRNKPWGRHGPGVVADHSSPREKWNFSIWPGVPPELFQCTPNYPRSIKTLNKQPYARVTCVPKDFRGPRIICIEPKENQFAQQGLMTLLYDLLTVHPLTRRSISFFNTRQNQDLCYRQDICTIDLKDASDNLSLELSRLVLPRWFFSLVTRYRSRNLIFRDEVWKPNCLATMGNALCFPLETLIFWAIARSVVSLLADRYHTPRGPLKVFGDDIICPKEACEEVILTLEGCGFVINKEKTCAKTLVKESCGEWVFNGENHRILKMKTTSVEDPRTWLQWREYINFLEGKGLEALSCTLSDCCTEYTGPLVKRWHRGYQCMQSLVPGLVTQGIRGELGGDYGLYAHFVRNDTTPFLNGALTRAKLSWVVNSQFGN